MYEAAPDDFLRLTGNQDSTPVHGGNIAVVRMQGLPYRANEEDIVREEWRCGSDGEEVGGEGQRYGVWGTEVKCCDGWVDGGKRKRMRTGKGKMVLKVKCG